MSLRLTLTLVILTLLAPARAQETRQGEPQKPDEQQIIDDFVTTRGFVFVDPSEGKKSSARPAGKAATPRPRRKSGKGGGETASAKPKPKPDAGQGSGDGAAPDGDAAGKVEALKVGGEGRPLALGYTLYRKEGGRYVAADESREFKSGDAIRIALETNTDGYVYIFNTTDGADPVMLYPHGGVEQGRHAIAAHSRESIPPEADIRFDETAGVERLYVVIARRPLDGLPSADELVRLCAGADECGWKPTPAQWARLKETFGQGGGAREGRLTMLARLQPVEPETLTRGLRIKREAPPPAVVRVSDSPAAALLLTTIDLIHK